MLLVVIGTWALNLERPQAGQARSWLAPLSAIGRERGSRLMLVVALIYSLTSVLGKGALQYLPATVFGPFYYSLLGLFTVAFFSWREVPVPERPWPPLPAPVPTPSLPSGSGVPGGISGMSSP